MLFRQILNPIYTARRIRLALWEKLNPGAPWITAEAVEILENYLSSHMTGVEYGSGRSTLWFAKRCRHLLSVESDPQWYQRVRTMLDAEQMTNVDLVLHQIEHATTDLWRTDYVPWPRFVAPRDIPLQSIDFALVDGAYREACIAYISPRLKVGGLLILDNMNWYPIEYWKIAPEFRLISAASNAKTQTGVFIKTQPS